MSTNGESPAVSRRESLVNVDAAVSHISRVLQTSRREAANRIAGPNALTHAYTYLELLRSEIERLGDTDA